MAAAMIPKTMTTIKIKAQSGRPQHLLLRLTEPSSLLDSNLAKGDDLAAMARVMGCTGVPPRLPGARGHDP